MDRFPAGKDGGGGAPGDHLGQGDNVEKGVE